MGDRGDAALSLPRKINAVYPPGDPIPARIRAKRIARHAMSPAQVRPGSFLTLHYRLAGPDGADIINTFETRPATLSIGSGELVRAVEERLIGLAEGARRSFELGPGVAFGERNPDLLQRVSRMLLDRHRDADGAYAVGDVVEFPIPGGQGVCAGVVREVGGESVLLDFNHPLAGQPVTFEVQLIGVL
jgi:FKBP-type peptidyl-prolyl cis-trans isomerase SlpA